MKTDFSSEDIELIEDCLKKILGDSDDLQGYLDDRVKAHEEQQWRDNTQYAIDKIQKIQQSKLKYVVIPTREHVGGGNGNYQPIDLDSELGAIEENIAKIVSKELSLPSNYLYINNDVGNAYNGHWDLVRITDSEKSEIKTSANDNACACYTLMQILRDISETAKGEIDRNIAPVLDNLLETEKGEITALLQKSVKEINGFKNAALLRKFFHAAILVHLQKTKTKVEEEDSSVLKSNHQIEMSALEKALSGLGINYLSTLEIRTCAETSTESEKEGYKNEIIKHFMRKDDDATKMDTVAKLKEYLKIKRNSEEDIEKKINDINQEVKKIAEEIEKKPQQHTALDSMAKDLKKALPNDFSTKSLAQPSEKSVFDLEYALDDSSDEESSSKADNFDSDAKWNSFKKERLETFKSNHNLGEEDIRNSFLLHAVGIKAIYGSTAESYYRKKKQSSFDEVDHKPDIMSAVTVSFKEIVKSICKVCYKFDSIGENNEEKMSDSISIEVTEQSKAEIEKFSELLINKRIIGTRLSELKLDKAETETLAKVACDNLFKIAEEKKLLFKSPIKASEWSHSEHNDSSKELKKAAGNFAKSEFQKLQYPIGEGNFLPLISEDSKPLRAEYKNKIKIFEFYKGKDFKSTIEKTWDLIKKCKSTSIFYFDQQDIAKAFMNDLAEDKSESPDSTAWKMALKYEEAIKVLKLNKERVKSKISADFNTKLFGLLSTNLKEIKLVRPTLPENYELTSGNIAEFLANLHLSNKSQTRTIRNFRNSKNGEEETFFRSWKLSDSKSSKPALERQQITTRLSRSDMVDNLGNYSEISRKLLIIEKDLKVENSTIARWIKEIINGKPIEELQNDQNRPVSFSNEHKKILINTAYLIFGTETARNPASLAANLMLMDLVQHSSSQSSQSKTTLSNAFSKIEFVDRYGGGESPMSIGKKSEKRDSPQKASSKQVKVSGEAVQSARALHKEFAKFMPFAYQYEGEAHGTSDDDLEKNAELLRRESEIVKKWILAKNIDPEFFTESMLIAYQDWGIIDPEKDKQENLVQLALNKWATIVEKNPAKELKAGNYKILSDLLGSKFKFSPDLDQRNKIRTTLCRRLEDLRSKDCHPQNEEKLFIETLDRILKSKRREEKSSIKTLDEIPKLKENTSEKFDKKKYSDLVTWATTQANSVTPSTHPERPSSPPIPSTEMKAEGLARSC